MAVATEMISHYPELVSLPVLPVEPLRGGAAEAPAAQGEPLTLEKLAEYPIVTYDFAFANRSLVQKAFESRGLKPHVVLSAQDSDVIKTYVELGLGVGILAKMAFDPKRDRDAARHRRRATCSNRAPRAWASSAAPTCGATPTTSSSCSRRSCRAPSSSARCVGEEGSRYEL